MEAMVLQGWNAILQIVGAVFNVVFFWLPNDPISEYLNDVSVQAASAQGVRWLNWFVDVEMAASLLSVFVSVLLLFAVFKVVWFVVNLILGALEAVPIV